MASLATMPEWSTTNWLGNDRYIAYVKLLPGTDPNGLAPAIRRMQERNQDMEGLKKAGCTSPRFFVLLKLAMP